MSHIIHTILFVHIYVNSLEGNCWRRRLEAPQTNGFGAEISAKIQDTTGHPFTFQKLLLWINWKWCCHVLPMVPSIDALIVQSRSDVSFICKAPSKESAAQLLIWQCSFGSIDRSLTLKISTILAANHGIAWGYDTHFPYAWEAGYDFDVQIPNHPQRDVMTKSVCLRVHFSAVLIL